MVIRGHRPCHVLSLPLREAPLINASESLEAFSFLLSVPGASEAVRTL